jgi:hypothetical protein
MKCQGEDKIAHKGKEPTGQIAVEVQAVLFFSTS